ncbi:CCA tRNA nucleotidyltransferase [Halobacillus karajensis]|uniref:CCA-adding enzyme n=1 Tax=Halobacillus karajensis TaxID=195088 RepID=A0A024P1S2_9BACI|nr:CCA tRNA nucleotidyltransferase [Halobacillus karajensis]CDQ19521.1 CCA-adding enzyme [Halobacillus karajensis]CDQ21983.1 CCA-adding enzyme [Halobacillus karajensis]CDQ27824.1 CCA-adding enzyme [Halobacillus karajensis]
MMIDQVFKQACEVIKVIEEAGGEAFIVGGSVRDYLSGREVNDIDIATSESPQRIQEIFDKVIPVGIEHGTVIVRHQGESYEVTTYRVEGGYEDYRHPDKVNFVDDIKLDLARRDFTMNAIAMSRNGELIDPYLGYESIKKKSIQAVGNPLERFREDPLRMMRAVRFASQLSFTIDSETKSALEEMSGLLACISIERIAIETEKLFSGKDYKLGLQLLEDSALQKHLPIFKGFQFQEDYPKAILYTWHEIIAFYTFSHSEISVEAFVNHWKLSNATKRKSEHLLSGLKIYENEKKVTPWLVYQLNEGSFASFERVCLALYDECDGLQNSMRRTKKDLIIHHRKELHFQAKDLISLFPARPKGPWISEWLEAIEYEVVTERIENNYEKIKEWVKSWNPPARN